MLEQRWLLDMGYPCSFGVALPQYKNDVIARVKSIRWDGVEYGHEFEVEYKERRTFSVNLHSYSSILPTVPLPGWNSTSFRHSGTQNTAIGPGFSAVDRSRDQRAYYSQWNRL